LRLDLTIGLIHVIAQQTQKIRACIVANWKGLSNFILVSFSNFSETKTNYKEPRPRNFFVDAVASF